MKISQAIKLCLDYHEANSQKKYTPLLPIHSY